MIQIEINGERYTGFERATVSRSLDAVSGRFSFEALGLNEGDPFQVGSEVGVYIVDDQVDQLFLSGFIDQITTRYSESSHSVSFAGRHRTQDVIDSTLDGSLEINGEVRLKDAIQQVLDFLESDILIQDPQGLDPVFQKTSKVSGQIGQGAFDLIEQYARLANVLLTTNANGDIIIQRGFDERLTGTLLHQINNNENNVKSAEINIDISERYNRYGVVSQGNPSTTEINEVGTQSLESVVNRSSSIVVDSEILRPERVYFQQAENTSSGTDSQNRAEWEKTVRKGRSISYNVTVFKHSNNGEIYEPNKIIKVFDDFGGLTDSDLLIKDVEFIQNLTDGNITKLRCVDPDSFKLPPEQERQSTSTARGTNAISVEKFKTNLENQ